MSTYMREPNEQRRRVNGVELTYFDWARSPEIQGEPTILLVHATGFHGRCWDQVIRRLEGRHVIAVDMRGHGRSAKTPPFTWDTFGHDLGELVEALGLHDTVAAGHSMGGHSLVTAAAMRPSAFQRLLLVDPVIKAPDDYNKPSPLQDIKEHPVARRRAIWESWESMFEHFSAREPFSAWDPAVLADYCRHGLIADEDTDNLVLACPPTVEASIYMNALSSNVHGLLPSIRQPVTILRAKLPPIDRAVMDFSVSPTWPQLAESFPHAVDVHLPELSHFIPMEQPKLVADYLLDC